MYVYKHDEFLLVTNFIIAHLHAQHVLYRSRDHVQVGSPGVHGVVRPLISSPGIPYI